MFKNAGHKVELFDTTYYNNIEGDISDSDGSKSERLMARPYEMPSIVKMTEKNTNVFQDFRKYVDNYSPDLLALSCTEDMWHVGHKLLQVVDDFNILTIVGGVFPTFGPELVLSYPEVDILCKGEGEEAMVELCSKIESGQSYDI